MRRSAGTFASSREADRAWQPPAADTPTSAPETSTAADPRDAELSELRDMVNTFKKMLGTLGNTA